ncbi:MAG: preprotein translocase subunit SecG [Acidimicrobiia bacterium]|nr:preprotein translocase subunit SecG [Acidimicrobiia bacterium]
MWLLLPFWLVSTLGLIFLVLLHSGRGGGLSDLMGGTSAASSAAGSTVMEKNLDRLTVITALVFTFSTVGMGLYLDV